MVRWWSSERDEGEMLNCSWERERFEDGVLLLFILMVGFSVFYFFFRYMLCMELRRGFFLPFFLFFCAGACGVRAGPGRHGSCGQNIFMEYSSSL